ncbi:MAG: hypothetical protein Q4C70_06945 [Planctomycetia bacterium]|nr:hypothetical protein [Planctomycetia bacterium]
MKKITLLLLFLLFFCGLLTPVFSDENRKQEISLFQTPIQDEFLEKSGLLLESFNGMVQPIDDPRGVRKILWSTRNDTEWIGVEFGKETTLGTRYAVATWGEPVTVGSLIVVSTSRPKLLKEGVLTEKNVKDSEKLSSESSEKLSVKSLTEQLTAELIADDNNWISGVRLLKNGDVTEDVTRSARDELTVWMFPPETKSRAIRFEHTPLATDKTYAGWIGSVYVLSERVTNLAPFATMRASAQEQYAERLNDGTYNDVWQTWDNGKEGNEMVISAENPEQITVIWDTPVTLRGVATHWTGFAAAEVAVYTGNPETHPSNSENPADWKTVASRTEIPHGYWRVLYPNFFDFGENYTTRAVRLTITQTTQETHPHLNEKTKEGKRVWLGELLAFSVLKDENRKDIEPEMARTGVRDRSETQGQEHPPIPVRFHLDRPGEVTLVLETPDGKRVRNLVSQTKFPAGENVVWWDGCDDLLRDKDKAKHGVYFIPERHVEPGKYVVRGIVHDPITPRYEFSFYMYGNPPWRTADNTGAWLTNHTPPSALAFLPAERTQIGEPQLYIGSYISEGGHGLAWFTPTGGEANHLELVKRGGVNWVGGVWTGARYLAVDNGPERNPEHRLYVVAGWEMEKESARGECRVTALTDAGDRAVCKYPYETNLTVDGKPNHEQAVAGVAVWNGMVLVALNQAENQLVCIDAKAKYKENNETENVLWTANLPTAGKLGGVAVDDAGKVFLMLDGDVYRFENLDAVRGNWPKPWMSGLDVPQGITFDADGNVYVSEAGTETNCVAVFSPDGKRIRTIGKKGPLQVGEYDEFQMQTPTGLAIDAENRLWVAENNHQPKRVSCWTREGMLIRAFYGPAQYGGGGNLDAGNPERCFFGGMEFQLDWKTGKDKLTRILARKEATKFARPDGGYATELPETAFYLNGKTYLTNCYNQNPVAGAPIASIYEFPTRTSAKKHDTQEIRPMAACGNAREWSIFRGEEYVERLPEGVRREDGTLNPARFLWSDANGDGQVQPSEVEFEAGPCGGVTVQVLDGKLTFLCARVGTKVKVETTAENGEKRVTEMEKFQTVAYPGVFGKSDVSESVSISARTSYLKFSFSRKQILADEVLPPASSGGDQALHDAESGETFVSLGIGGFAQDSLCGAKNGVAKWCYPSVWPGLHASHEAHVPTFRGELVGTTRLLGDAVRLKNYPSKMVAVNGNMGTIYLFTMDGMFVAQLFHDERIAHGWTMPVAQRGTDLSPLTLNGENFWPSICQFADGKTCLVDGARTAIITLEGLDTVRALPTSSVTVTHEDIQRCLDWNMEQEKLRQSVTGKKIVTIPIRKGKSGENTGEKTGENAGENLDENSDEKWKGADWAVIDRSGVAAWFDSNSKPYDVTAAAMVTDGKLCVKYRTGDKNLLMNSGENPNALFKSGGCLDLMIGASAPVSVDSVSATAATTKIDPERKNPVAGDMRLLVTLVKGEPRAVLYRAVVPGTKKSVPFSSPWRTLYIDQVEDVSDKIGFTADDSGNFEISVPLDVIQLEPRPGLTIKGDFGILRGVDFQTISRTYWSNKATGITSDVPSEAEFAVPLWGEWKFVAE